MEWNRTQLRFIEDHRDLFEKEDWDGLYSKSAEILSPFERRHLMIGLAVVVGLTIELELCESKGGLELFVITSSGNDISIIQRYDLRDLSDLNIVKVLIGALKTMGLSQGLIEKVIGRMKVKRV